MSFTETLHKLGFSPIEATVYTTLCQNGALTGYEVAKLTGISRSNVYAALHNLYEKGKCYLSEGDSAKYIAISKEDLLLSTEREMKKNLEAIEKYYPERIEPSEPYISIKGYENVLDKIKNCILLCKSHLYISTNSCYLELIEKELLEIADKRRVTIITEAPFKLPDSIKIYTRGKNADGFHIIMDTHSVLTADLSLENAQCLFSKNPSLVRLMRESFITELDMITLKNH